jgi:cell division septal protein FtsQ
MGKTSRSSRTFLRRSLWGFGTIASILALCALSCALARSPLFLVKQVELEASGRPGPDAIRSMSGIRPGMNMLSLDTEEVSRRLETHPWIQHATVVKRLPDQVRIKVLERRPAVLVGVQGCLYYMDAEGKILDKVEPGASLDFPMMTGLEQDVEGARRCGDGRDLQQALSLLRVLQATPALGSVSEVQIDRSEGLSFVLEGFPVPVHVGWSGFFEKMIRFEKALPSLASQLNGIERVDLRFSGQIVLKQRDGGKARVPRRDGTETLAGSDPSLHPTT